MKSEIYYYIRTPGNKLVATVCLVPAGEDYWYRGVALCSIKDQFSRKIGRKIAHGRAESAHDGNRKPVDDINSFTAGTLRMLAPHIDFLSKTLLMEELSPHEKYLISKLEQKGCQS